MYSVVLGLCFALASGAYAQNVKVPKPKIYTPGEGDVLDNSSPLAHLPPALTPKAIKNVMRKVDDWELNRSRPCFSRS